MFFLLHLPLFLLKELFWITQRILPPICGKLLSHHFGICSLATMLSRMWLCYNQTCLSQLLLREHQNNQCLVDLHSSLLCILLMQRFALIADHLGLSRDCTAWFAHSADTAPPNANKITLLPIRMSALTSSLSRM